MAEGCSVGRTLDDSETIEQIWRSATQDHATANAALKALLQGPPTGRRTGWHEPDAARSRVSDSEHLVQALVHVHEVFGYEQWYLFDDVWAAGHPKLASSLLRYASSWGPFDTAQATLQGA